MQKFFLSFIQSAAIKWLTSAQGIFFLGIIFGAIMAWVTGLTNFFNQYAPLSYVLGFSIGLIVLLLIALLIIQIFSCLNFKIKTLKETYIEYMMEDNHMSIKSSSNIYKTPRSGPAQQQVIQFNLIAVDPTKRTNSKGKKEISGQPALSPANSSQDKKQAEGNYDITVLFDKPIVNVKTPRIERIAGDLPKILSGYSDERWAIVILSGVRNGARFKVVFNHDECIQKN